MAIISLLVYEFFLELRYIWFIRPDQALMIRVVAAIAIVVILGLWIRFPSPLAVAVVAAAGFAAPPLLDGETFVGWDIPFIIGAAIPVGMLVGVTYLRRKWIAFGSERKIQMEAR